MRVLIFALVFVYYSNAINIIIVNDVDDYDCHFSACKSKCTEYNLTSIGCGTSCYYDVVLQCFIANVNCQYRNNITKEFTKVKTVCGP
ncbi:unnamed protein product, partial [Brachionus calyciflorus]